MVKACFYCNEEMHDFKGYYVHGSSAAFERCKQIRENGPTLQDIWDICKPPSSLSELEKDSA